MSSEHLHEAQMKIEATLPPLSSQHNELKLSLETWMFHIGNILHSLSQGAKDCMTARTVMNPVWKVAPTLSGGVWEGILMS